MNGWVGIGEERRVECSNWLPSIQTRAGEARRTDGEISLAGWRHILYDLLALVRVAFGEVACWSGRSSRLIGCQL